jgi:AcrR family transcriptional regulator
MRGRKKSDETRANIVRCAAGVFSQREFHEVLIDEIALESGIGKGTLYRYFRSKEELYIASIRDGLDELHSGLVTVLKSDLPLESMISGFVRTLVGYFWKQRDFLILMHRLESKLNSKERADWENRRTEVSLIMRRVLDRAALRGEIARVNARLAVGVLQGMIRGACVYRNDHDRPDEVARLVTQMFLHGLSGNQTPQAQRLRAVRAV